MSDTDGDAEVMTPREDQEEIIDSDAYPMRVRAGAGTGKTFTMVRKVERLLEDGVAPDRILALTFTNKAADSMREKLVETVGPRAHDIEAYTYHAVCHDLLSEYAYHADVDPGYDIATDADRLAIVYDVLDEVPYRFTSPDIRQDFDWGTDVADHLLVFVQVMKRSGISPEDLRKYLVSPSRLIELESVVEAVETAVEDHLRVGWRSMDDARVDEMRERLDAFGDALAAQRSSLADEGAERDVGRYLAAMIDVAGELRSFFAVERSAIVDGDIPGAQRLPAHLFGSYGSPPKGMPKIDVQLPATLEQFVDDCQTVSDLVAGYEAYQHRLRTENLLDFNDLVLETLELLGDDAVDDWITGQYDYVFCDEFQDTDTVQFELVRRLVTDDRLFVVGDDDQAIYEWRGANVENIGPRLTEAYPNVTDRELEENFRSRQPILDLANDALDRLDRRGSDKTLTAVGDNADATSGVVTVTGAEEADEQADQIANALTRLLDADTELADEPYDPGDVAILVRKKRHAEPIIAALRERGIPYELAGDLAPDSIGVETVIAGLKALADPADEVSLNRLLRMRYRLHEDDLRQLNTAGDDVPVWENLRRLPLEWFEEPDRVERAREDLTELWARKETTSVSGIYRELKDQLNLEWFLSAQERRDLRALDDLVEDFEAAEVEPELSTEFVEFLARHGGVSEGSSQSMEDQPDLDAAAVSIMTIHKSKGLEFPVVVLPRLEADQWSPRARDFDPVEHAVDGGDPTAIDFARRDLREARRLLHVAITRSEELTVLVGRSEDDDGGGSEEEMAVDRIDAVLEGVVPWRASGVEFPVWQTIQQSLPATAVDGTDSLAAPVDATERVAARDDGEGLDRPAAGRRVIELARRMLAGDLAAPETPAIAPDLLHPVDERQVRRRHSYTALDTLGTCTRQHYLDYVVRAFDDPLAAADGGSDGPSGRVVGILFHDTAELATQREADTPAAWRAIAERLATARGQEEALEAVGECIDRYFATEVAAWTVLEAERSFELTVDGSQVVGKIDAICRRPDGELVVVDYKTTTETRNLDEDIQLPIYLLACAELLDEPVREAGFAYVGAAGPAVETRRFDDEALAAARERMGERAEAAEASQYAEYTAGEHCRWCPHRSLSCAPEGIDE